MSFSESAIASNQIKKEISTSVDEIITTKLNYPPIIYDMSSKVYVTTDDSWVTTYRRATINYSIAIPDCEENFMNSKTPVRSYGIEFEVLLLTSDNCWFQAAKTEKQLITVSTVNNTSIAATGRTFTIDGIVHEPYYTITAGLLIMYVYDGVDDDANCIAVRMMAPSINNFFQDPEPEPEDRE